jgi:endonuclease YncB( thermonuclease family)
MVEEISSLPFTIYLALSLLSIALSIISSLCRRQIATATDIPKIWFAENRVEQARVVKVNDADGLRIELHESNVKKSRLNTISVRLAGIDAPELGKYGFTSQPVSPSS